MKITNEILIKKLKECVIMIFISILLIAITIALIVTQHFLDMTMINYGVNSDGGNWFGLRTQMAFLINLVLYLSIGISVIIISLQIYSLIQLVKLYSPLETEVEKRN